MKHLLLTTIAAVVLVGCGESQQSAPAPKRPIEDSAGAGDIEAVKQHIAAGTDVNTKGSGGITPLLAAAMEGQNDIAELLISKGAAVNARDDKGMVPLHFAAQKGHKETVELLIAKGAKVNTKDYFDKTPLDRAEEVNEADSAELKAAKKEIADLLRKHELNQLMPRLVQHGRFAFSFDANEGKIYEVQDSFDLLNWEVIKTYTGAGDTVRFDEDRDHDPPQWFYRVKMVE